MSTPYPWIKDSQYGTTPLETGYLEVTSTNGLYLNSTTSGTNSNAILMKGFITGGSTPVTCYYYCDKLRYYPNVWGGETFLSQDMLKFATAADNALSQLNYAGLTFYNPGVTTYFQSSNSGAYQTIGSSGEEIRISSNSGSGNIYFTAAGLYLNGSPIGGGGGGGVTDITAGTGISVSQTTGSVTITNTGWGPGVISSLSTSSTNILTVDFQNFQQGTAELTTAGSGVLGGELVKIDGFSFSIAIPQGQYTIILGVENSTGNAEQITLDISSPGSSTYRCNFRNIFVTTDGSYPLQTNPKFIVLTVTYDSVNSRYFIAGSGFNS